MPGICPFWVLAAGFAAVVSSDAVGAQDITRPLVMLDPPGDSIREECYIRRRDEQLVGDFLLEVRQVEMVGEPWIWTHYRIRDFGLVHGAPLNAGSDRYYLTDSSGLLQAQTVIYKNPASRWVVNCSRVDGGYRASGDLTPDAVVEISCEEDILNGLAYEQWCRDFAKRPAGSQDTVRFVSLARNGLHLVEQTWTVGLMDEIRTHFGKSQVRRLEVSSPPHDVFSYWYDPEDGDFLAWEDHEEQVERSYEEDVLKHLNQDPIPDRTESLGADLSPDLSHSWDVDELLLEIPRTVRGVSPEHLDRFTDVEIVEASDRAVVLRLRRRPLLPDPERKKATGISREVAEALFADEDVQTGSTALRKCAAIVARDRTDPVEIALRLAHFVSTQIQGAEDFAWESAAATLERKKGDATESALLLTALCRSRGIPARYVGGYVVNGPYMLGSAWTEIWVDGDWHPLHPEYRGTLRPLLLPTWTATHTPESDRADMVTLPSSGIRVLGLEVGGRWLEFQDPRMAPRLEGDDLVAPLLGVRLALAEGWEYRAEAAHNEGFSCGSIVPSWGGQGLVLEVFTAPQNWVESQWERSEAQVFFHRVASSAWFFPATDEGWGWVFLYRPPEVLRVALPPGSPATLADYQPLLDGLEFRNCVLCDEE